MMEICHAPSKHLGSIPEGHCPLLDSSARSHPGPAELIEAVYLGVAPGPDAEAVQQRAGGLPDKNIDIDRSHDLPLDQKR